MSWKPVLLTVGNKPPQVLASVTDGMLKLQISPEIAQMVGLTLRRAFAAFVGTAGEQGQIKLVAEDGGGGRVKGGSTSPSVYVPAENSWPEMEANTKCDFEIREDDKALIVNLPWYSGAAPELLRGNQKVSAVLGAQICDRYRRGASRRKLAEKYGLSEATVVQYTSDPETVTAHNAAVQAYRASREAQALIGGPALQAASEKPPVTRCPPRQATGIRKSLRT